MSSRALAVVFASSEAVPFCKTGGLADVAGALPAALARGGARVSLFLPLYRSARGSAAGAEELPGRFRVRFGAEAVEVRLRRVGRKDDATAAYLVDCPRFFDRDGLYGEAGEDYTDNAERFAVFSRAVIEGVRLARLAPDVFHCNDWQTGLIPVYLKTCYADDAELSGAGTVFTIHNLAYQGIFPKEAMEKIGLPWSEFTAERLEFYDKVCFLKGGVACADLINTVSPRYAEEIQTPEFGGGLDGVLRGRRESLFGILNGLDLRAWDPSTDAAINSRFGTRDFETGKAACKAALQKDCGWEPDPAVMVIGSVSRLDHQKGLDLVLDALPERLEEGARYVLLGSGDRVLEKRFSEFARRYPDRVHCRNSFDEPFAHRIYAGADLFLMPSRFEPCGLGQMIAMRYGTLPLGTRTGGLADTVAPHGFLAERASAESLDAVLKEAADVFEKREEWRARVRGAMRADFAWDASARRYLDLYARVRKLKDGSIA